MRNQLQNGKTPHDGGIIWCSVLRSTIVWPTEASKRNKIERKNIAADQIDLIIRCARHSAKTISRTFWQSQIFSVVLNSFFFSSYANWPRPLNRNCDVMQRNARTSRRKKKKKKNHVAQRIMRLTECWLHIAVRPPTCESMDAVWRRRHCRCFAFCTLTEIRRIRPKEFERCFCFGFSYFHLATIAEFFSWMKKM